MNADFWSAFLLPLPATQEWGEDQERGIFTKAPPLPGPLLHPMEEREFLWLQPEPNSRTTSNIQLPMGHGLAPYSMFGVGCSMFDVPLVGV
jgi:hypothetical protein